MNLLEFFDGIGEELVEELKKQLIALDKKATGSLINSLNYRLIVDESQRLVRNIRVELLAAEHLKYVDGGRKKGAKMPPPQKLDKWIVARNIAPRDKKGRFISRKSLQFLIARSISKNGIPRTDVIKKSLDAVYNNNKEKLEEAAVESLREFINTIF